MGLLGGLGQLSDMAQTNQTVTQDISAIADTGTKIYCALHPKDIRCIPKPSQAAELPSSTNWTPWIIGGVAVIGLGFVLYKFKGGKRRPKRRR